MNRWVMFQGTATQAAVPDKAIINGVKWKEQKCGDNSLKVEWSEVGWNGAVGNLNGVKQN
jgi:hypothetical protein